MIARVSLLCKASTRAGLDISLGSFFIFALCFHIWLLLRGTHEKAGGKTSCSSKSSVLSMNLTCNNLKLFICVTSVKDGPLSPAKRSHSILSEILKYSLQDSFMLFKVSSPFIGTILNPIQYGLF